MTSREPQNFLAASPPGAGASWKTAAAGASCLRRPVLEDALSRTQRVLGSKRGQSTGNADEQTAGGIEPFEQRADLDQARVRQSAGVISYDDGRRRAAWTGAGRTRTFQPTARHRFRTAIRTRRTRQVRPKAGLGSQSSPGFQRAVEDAAAELLAPPPGRRDSPRSCLKGA